MRRPRSDSGGGGDEAGGGAAWAAAVLRVMAGKASTTTVARATPVRACHGSAHRVRGRGLLIILLVLLLVAVTGIAYLGLYPPNPAPKAVQKVVPNEKFQTR